VQCYLAITMVQGSVLAQKERKQLTLLHSKTLAET
jgi:hypothetical protein